jgi:hypothetical protein
VPNGHENMRTASFVCNITSIPSGESSPSNKDMQILKKKNFQLFSDDLGKVLDSELGGPFEKLVFNCLQAAEEEYDEGFHSDDKMKKDAEKLYKMGQGKFGTDESGLFKILCSCPPEYLKKLNLLYAEKYGFTLVKALETKSAEMSKMRPCS